jgi:hypothetical protein
MHHLITIFIKKTTQSSKKSFHEVINDGKTIVQLTESAPIGDKERFSTVARSSSTDAEMGAVPLLSGLISTWIFLSISSSLSLSELE